MSRLCTLAMLACLMLAAGAGSAVATPLEPRDGVAYSGVTTGGIGAEADRTLASFLSASGQPSVAILNHFSSHELSSFGWVLHELDRRPAVGMLSWWLSTPSHSPGTPGGSSASVARGDVDAYILARASEVRAYGKPLFIRLNWEMNAFFWPWGAYDETGNARPGNSHADYRNMWRRTVILFRGGTRATINARLTALGMPGLTSPVASVPATANVAWVWIPNYGNNPGNDDAFAYWPGDEYVDWVGVDWYAWDSQSVDDQSALPNAIYDRLSGPGSTGKKPFMIAEWNVHHADLPAYATDIFDWMEARPKVKAALLFNLPIGEGRLPLEATPDTRAVYRQRISAARWLKDFSQGGADAVGPPPAAPAARTKVGGRGPKIVLRRTARLPGARTAGVRVVVKSTSGVSRVAMFLDGRRIARTSLRIVSVKHLRARLTPGRHTIRIVALDRLGRKSTLKRRFAVA